jgi:hypothetical protein
MSESLTTDTISTNLFRQKRTPSLQKYSKISGTKAKNAITMPLTPQQNSGTTFDF